MTALNSAKWYHGTDTRFDAWEFPPKAPSPIEIGHTALFFTSSREYAAGAGPHICTVTIDSATKVLQPGQLSAESVELRKRVAADNELSGHCEWVKNDEAWTRGWITGEVMRFAADMANPAVAKLITSRLAHIATSVQKACIPPLSNQKAIDVAQQNLTRAWIEILVTKAKEMGFQAVLGAEIDRHSNATRPASQPWLAVLDPSIISAPSWE